MQPESHDLRARAALRSPASFEVVSELPSGTVTFLFTDIEGSTSLLRRIGAGYADVLAEHQRIIRDAFAAHGGHEVDTQGDSFFVAFRRAKDAVAAAVDAQRDLAAHSWPEDVEVKVRMGLHTGEPRVGGQRYVGLGVHKAARIGAAGHGGQVLLSRTTRELVEDELPPGVGVRDLGERRLKDIERPERLSQLVIDGLPSEFGPLKTLDVELARRRRRMYAGSALIGVLAAAVAIPVFALGQGDGGTDARVEPNFVAVVDPGANRVVDSVPAGARPLGVAVSKGAVWIANVDDETLSRIEPRTRTLVRTIGLDATPTGVAFGSGSVWVANGILGSATRVDPGANAAVATVDITFRSTGGTIAVGEGAVWAAFGNGEIARVDPGSHAVTTGVAGTTPSAIAVFEGSVWVANAGSSTISRINPRTVSAVSEITVGRRPRGLAVGEGSLWVANEEDDSVHRIDAASSSTTATIPVGDGPTAVAYDFGSVWVANTNDGTVSRIDPASNSVVKTITVGNRPSGIAAGAGAVWVTVQAAA
jgi:YVTN family beta-propeller protein